MLCNKAQSNGVLFKTAKKILYPFGWHALFRAIHEKQSQKLSDLVEQFRQTHNRDAWR